MKYTTNLQGSIIYSIGDAHGWGREIDLFIKMIEQFEVHRGNSDYSIVQLGDLCDAFYLPSDSSPENILREIDIRARHYPALDYDLCTKDIIEWDRENGIRRIDSVSRILRSPAPETVAALYHAVRSYETLKLFSEEEQSNSCFTVLLGNHDLDLLRGRCRYGRAQKYILLCLLGFSPDQVIEHMTHGIPETILEHPWLKWLHERPHIALTQDTVYMHGGPTKKESEKLFTEYASNPNAFQTWLDTLDRARTRGYDEPEFKEHDCFLCPDCLFNNGECLPETAENDWVKDPCIVTRFCIAAERKYLAVGHSPFIDFPKSQYIDLNNPEYYEYFSTPAILSPNKSLIKHDTNMKRKGRLWTCRHQVGSEIWTGFRVTNMKEVPLRSHE